MNNEIMTSDDIKTLNEQDEKTLAIWWCKLNRYDWVKQLKNEPNDKEEWKPNSRRWQIMNHIENKIGTKKCSREWNIDRMTDEQHEQWFNNRFLEIKNVLL